tara:strand:- start:215 stop:1006 length:792 start_codon:yes stop_codon:yes gene_type:complete
MGGIPCVPLVEDGPMKNERFNQVVAIAVVLGLCVLIPCPSPIEAQDAPERGPTGLNIHTAFQKSEGLHQFGELSDGGYGANAGVTWMPSTTGNVGLRFDFSYTVYGSESTPTCLTTPCWIEGDLVTRNSIFQVGMGPEWTMNNGPIQPYLYAIAGPSSFFTTLEARHCGRRVYDDCSETNPDTYQSDWGLVWNAGGGLRYHFSEFFGLDLSYTYQHHGVRDYLVEGDLALNDDGTITIDNLRHSRANSLVFQIGLNINVPQWG